MRYLALAAGLLALTACGGTETANQDVAATDLGTSENILVGDTTMNAGMAGGAVTVTVNGVRPNGGPVLVALQNEADFAKSAAVYSAKVDPTAATVTATISGVAPGTYAAAVVQDTNNDGTFTIGATGPTEPFGFSGTAQAGAPTFPPASFQVAQTGGNATVNLSGGGSGN